MDQNIQLSLWVLRLKSRASNLIENPAVIATQPLECCSFTQGWHDFAGERQLKH
jgi:hypothetical protein